MSAQAASPPEALAHIAQLIEAGGQITIGQIHPIACAAIAHDGRNSLAMLRRQPGETVPQLIARLDAAIASARNGNSLTDEINRPMPSRRP